MPSENCVAFTHLLLAEEMYNQLRNCSKQYKIYRLYMGYMNIVNLTTAEDIEVFT